VRRRKKKKGLKAALIQHLPIEEVHTHLADEDCQCERCGNSLHHMGQKAVREEVVFIPATLKKKVYIEHSYDCPTCRRSEGVSSIKRAPAPKAPLAKSFAGPTVLAWLFHQKYELSLPLYRQEKEWLNYGLSVSRKTLANWIIRSAQEWLAPIYERLRQSLIKESVIHADETPFQVLNRSDGKPATSDARIWLFQTLEKAAHPIIFYHASLTRERQNITDILTDSYQGYCHCDGYSAYQNISGLTVVACWAHVRRKFHEAGGDQGKAALGVAYCNQLFAIEKKLEKLTDLERKKQRDIHLRPVLEEFWKWLENLPVLSKSKLGKAVSSGIKLQEALMQVLEDGRLVLSNNAAERHIRPLAIGRKNFLFSTSEEGAEANAMAYTIIETAKANGLKPYNYLCHLFSELPNENFRCNPQLLDNYLPWSESIQQTCQ